MSDENHGSTPDDVLAMRALIRERDTPQGDTDVSAETLQAFYKGELPDDKAQEVALAVAATPSLAQDLRFTVALEREHEDSVNREIHNSRSRSRMVWTGVVALVAAVLAFLVLRPPAPKPGGSDDVRAGTEASGITSTVPPEGLPRHAFELSWSGGPPDAAFEVQVTTADLDVVFQAFDRHTSTLRVPGEALVNVEPGADLLWRVTAIEADGRRARSPAFTVRVR